MALSPTRVVGAVASRWGGDDIKFGVLRPSAVDDGDGVRSAMNQMSRVLESPQSSLRTALTSMEQHLANEDKELSQQKKRLEILEMQLAAAVASCDSCESPSAMEVANALEDEGDIKAAAALCRYVVSHRESAYGARDPRAQEALRKLASLTHDSGDVKAAEPMYRELLSAFASTLGEKHQTTLRAMVDLAMAVRDLGDLEQAELLLRDALSGQLQLHGRRHRATLGTIGNLADVLREQGRFEDATAMFGSNLAIAVDALGMPHMTTLVLGAKAARLRHESATSAGHAEEARQAVEQMQTVVQAMEQALGPKHPQALKYTAVLAAMR